MLAKLAKREFCWGILVVGLLLSPVLGQEKKPTATEQDLQSLQGEWKFEWMEMDGERRPPDESQARSPVVIRDKDMRHGDIALSFKIDAGTDPKVIDVTLKTDNAPSPSFEGIYKLQDDMLTICLYADEGGKQRPTEFKTQPDSKFVVVHLSRMKK